jgi:FkbM family methyltransferase
MWWYKLIKLMHIICEPFFIRAMVKGAVAGTEHRLVLRRLNFDLIVDVGANRGQFALISRKIFPFAKVYSFEPLSEPIQIYKRIFDRDPNVILYPFAIGKEKKITTIYVTKDDDSSSLLPITKMQSNLFPGAVEKETRQVMVCPLSQLIDPVLIPPASLLKIDVQGYELDVLQGCEDILQYFSHLYVECSFIELYAGQALAHQILAWLEERNFILSGVHNLYYGKNGMSVQGDFLFTQKKNKEDR